MCLYHLILVTELHLQHQIEEYSLCITCKSRLMVRLQSFVSNITTLQE